MCLCHKYTVTLTVDYPTAANFNMFRLGLFLTSVIFSNFCNCYKVLGIFHLPTKSHNKLATKFFYEIASKGHEVTFITPYEGRTNVTNLKEIPVKGLEEILPIPSVEFDKSFLVATDFFLTMHYNFSAHLLKNEEVQNLLNSDVKFDVVIVYQYMNDALYSFAHHFKVPLILFSPIPLYTSERFLLSHVGLPSYVPNVLTEYTGRMTFWQRLKNTCYDIFMIFHYVWFISPKHNELVQQYMPGKPNLYKFIKNVSLLFINSHVSTNEVLPQMPNVVEVGGYHIEEPKPLPLDLKKFLDDSPNGVILFTMGSMLSSADFPEKKINAFLRVFSKLKENVLWKFESNKLQELPINVKIMKWLPQSDVLAHSNVKAFISHGGLLGIMESVYFAKPIVAIPILADQKLNVALLAVHEFGVHVPYEEITEKKLTWALNEILNNPKYRNNIKRRSLILKDGFVKPVDKIVPWVEYVIRHRGNPHVNYSRTTSDFAHFNILYVGTIIVVFVIICIVLFIKKIFLKNLKK